MSDNMAADRQFAVCAGGLGPRGLLRRNNAPAEVRYTFCTMVTDWDEYQEMANSARKCGFDDSNTEFLVLDNSMGNKADAYVATNEFLQSAAGDLVVILHQDITFSEMTERDLSSRICGLEARDSSWAICGNAGHTSDGWPEMYISHYHVGFETHGGPFPARVVSLDENFLILKKAANLAVSRDLVGFHHYGADLCSVAELLGWNSYVIDFLVFHKSAGRPDEAYMASRERIATKYSRFLRSRWIHLVTKRPYYISGSAFQRRIVPPLTKVAKALGILPRTAQVESLTRRARRDRSISRQDLR